ncbi:MAG: helix-turn-helix domain-containing protein [Thermoplasmatota archaeon]
MRKAVIEITPNAVARKLQGRIYESIESIEGREILKLDFEKRTKLVIADFIMKPGLKPDDVKLPRGVEILNILKAEGDRYTILLRASPPGKKLGAIFSLFDLDVVYDLPYRATLDTIKLSAIGENEPLNKLIKILGLLGKVERISFMNASFSEHGLLNVLTDKQKDIMIEAKRNGYYNYPRKVNAQELSEKLGISKATTVEHLRKAEMRLISNLLAGY